MGKDSFDFVFFVHIAYLGIAYNGCIFCPNRVRIRPIHDDVQPPCQRDANIVRYIHLNEIRDQYSSGIFIFPPNAKIPLHDHPGMSVVSRLLYGDMHVSSLDLLRESEVEKYNIKDIKHPLQHVVGAKFAVRRAGEHLQAGDVGCLYPYEGNLHEFTAGPDGAAILDILLPPYDADGNRDCTFYETHEMKPADRDNEQHGATLPIIPKDNGVNELCLIVPTGQPEDFHCISGRYLDLGVAS
jgi:PCO_ADO